MHFRPITLLISSALTLLTSAVFGCDFKSWPTATSTITLTSTISVSGTKDEGYKRYKAGGKMGDGSQSESQKPLFKLASGATLKNVIIGSPGADGIHCDGSCTLENVWWEDVGEDAATFRSSDSNAVFTVKYGGAKSASDKVFQHNGPGTVKITNFQVENFGKLYKSCGSCGKQMARKAVLDCILAKNGKQIASVNTNYGDQVYLKNLYLTSVNKVCAIYNGVTSGEPKLVKEFGTGDKPYGGCNF